VSSSGGPRGASGSTMTKLALFVFFVMTRALHPMLIDSSKVEGKILYAKNTPIALNKLLTLVLMNMVALLVDGMRGVRLCWQPRCLAIFGMIGVVYALGDFLEMLSMAKLSGGVYQVLLQTKLLITALMCMWLKGTGQTPLQWHVLFSMFLSVSAFVLVDQGGDGGSSALPIMAVLTVLMKVAVSCYCAVLSEKYLKAFSDMPLYAKISGLSLTWAIASLLLCMTEKQVARQGFFAHWDHVTWWVTASFVIKTVSTMYLLQALDSVQKNIGEALALIVIYLSQVAIAGFSEAFDLSVFLLAVLVVILVKTYLISPKPKPTGVKPASRQMKLVSLKHEGSPVMQSLGIRSMTCQVQGSLPQGVFYGVLGGLHPVCGNTDPNGAESCELMMLSEAQGSTSALPVLPTESLTVLGEVRGPGAPRQVVTSETCMRDLEQARARFADDMSHVSSMV